jgi:lipopolysaccharide transport system ATP-binding protein
MKPVMSIEHVWKKYHIGSAHGSLRDTIPALVRRVTGNQAKHEDAAGVFWALQDVTFDVQRGETLGIVGHNGAGKSTMLKLLSRICQQTKGRIHVNGRLAALIEVGAGFHPDLTGRENIYLNGTIMGLRHKQIDKLFDQIVAFSELERFLDMPVKRYSSGMSVRLGFSVAAHIDPEILLVDEVLAVGDLAFQQKCYKRILDLKERGTTIIFISHNLEAVQRLCDRCILLEKGQITMEGSPEATILRYRQDVLRHSKQKLRTPDGKLFVPEENNDIVFEQVSLHNGSAEPTDTFQTGKKLLLKARCKVKRAIKAPSVTVTIERIDGLICHEASTILSGLQWQQWHTGGSFELEYPKLNLLPNTYQVKLRIYEGQNPAPLAVLANRLYLHVTSEKAGRGTVYLDHGWQSAMQ